jgi:hypothetical protein
MLMGVGVPAPVFFARRGAEDAELLNHEDAKDAKEEGKRNNYKTLHDYIM